MSYPHTRTYKYKTRAGAEKGVQHWAQYWTDRGYNIYMCHVIQRSKIINNITYDYAVLIVFFEESN